MPTLLALSIGPDIPGDRGTHLVGQNPRCDVRLASCRVSRRHRIIAMERAAVVVRDLGSINGTWMNGHRVAAGCIRPGDEVAIAEMRYRLGESEALRAATVDVPGRPQDESAATDRLMLSAVHPWVAHAPYELHADMNS
jgi:FHA domain-containing protein